MTAVEAITLHLITMVIPQLLSLFAHCLLTRGDEGTGKRLSTWCQAWDYHRRWRRYTQLLARIGLNVGSGAIGDVFSYAEDDMKTDAKLKEHLAHWGIDAAALKKTEKTMAEMELDLNQKFEWCTLLGQYWVSSAEVLVWWQGACA